MAVMIVIIVTKKIFVKGWNGWKANFLGSFYLHYKNSKIMTDTAAIY